MIDIFEKPYSIVELQKKFGNASDFWIKFNGQFNKSLDKSAEDMCKYFNEEFFPLLQYLSFLEMGDNIMVQLQQPGTPKYDAVLYKNDHEFECIQVTLARDAVAENALKQSLDRQDCEVITDILAPIDTDSIRNYQEALKVERDSTKRADLKRSIRQLMSMNKHFSEMNMHVDDRSIEIRLIKEAIFKKISKGNLAVNPLSVLIVVYRTKNYCYQSLEKLTPEEERTLKIFCLEKKVFDYYPKVCLVHYRGQECQPDVVYPITIVK